MCINEENNNEENIRYGASSRDTFIDWLRIEIFLFSLTAFC